MVRIILSTFKNRWCGALWQSLGMKVIPTINWGTHASYEFCFDGVEEGSVVAVATYCKEKHAVEIVEATINQSCEEIAALVIAQILKVFFDYWRTKSWKYAMLTSTGGMPSSHSALVVAVMISVGIYEGFGTPIFALSVTLALVVMHDAAGIRRAAGKQAEAINFLFSKLEMQGIKLDKKLKELLGHHPLEVIAGAVLGIAVALAMHELFPL